MAQLDTFHHVVREALRKDGWKITDDPLYLQYGGVDYAIDFGAEPLIVAEKSCEKVAIEVKSFLVGSPTSPLKVVNKSRTFIWTRSPGGALGYTCCERE